MKARVLLRTALYGNPGSYCWLHDKPWGECLSGDRPFLGKHSHKACDLSSLGLTRFTRGQFIFNTAWTPFAIATALILSLVNTSHYTISGCLAIVIGLSPAALWSFARLWRRLAVEGLVVIIAVPWILPPSIGMAMLIGGLALYCLIVVPYYLHRLLPVPTKQLQAEKERLQIRIAELEREVGIPDD